MAKEEQIKRLQAIINTHQWGIDNIPKSNKYANERSLKIIKECEEKIKKLEEME